jgi:hypothetical protein
MMNHLKRVFILGAGFSKPAGMPLATELLPLLADRLKLEEMQGWLNGLRDRLAWLSEADETPGAFKVNIEQVFHYANFDAEVHRLRQHLSPVGRGDGPGTAWTDAEAITAWMSYLEDALRDEIVEKENLADSSSILRWAEAVDERDTVLTFNYDTLVEKSLANAGRTWNHAIPSADHAGIPVCKLHGSIDWIVAHRAEPFFSELDLLFDKDNANRSEQNTGHVEDDCRLWRCRTWQQLEKWNAGRDLQSIPENASPKTVGIAGLGAYKQLHQIPGLGRVWTHAMRALYDAEKCVVVGFSMSDFDAMAQMQFAQVALARARESKPLPVSVIDPYLDDGMKSRFRRVFRTVDFISVPHENVDWTAWKTRRRDGSQFPKQ